jgi:hypothetical protein
MKERGKFVMIRCHSDWVKVKTPFSPCPLMLSAAFMNILSQWLSKWRPTNDLEFLPYLNLKIYIKFRFLKLKNFVILKIWKKNSLKISKIIQIYTRKKILNIFAGKFIIFF